MTYMGVKVGRLVKFPKLHEIKLIKHKFFLLIPVRSCFTFIERLVITVHCKYTVSTPQKDKMSAVKMI